MPTTWAAIAVYFQLAELNTAQALAAYAPMVTIRGSLAYTNPQTTYKFQFSFIRSSLRAA